MIKAVLLLAAIFGAATAAQSQSPPQSLGGQILSYALRREYSPKDRADLARLYGAYCREILNGVPTNTPAEQAWVTEEGGSTDTNRMYRLVQSKEWARYQLKETFSECLTKVSRLQQLQSQEARGAEAGELISLAITFNESSDLSAYATRVGLQSDIFRLGSAFRRILLIAALRTLDSK